MAEGNAVVLKYLLITYSMHVLVVHSLLFTVQRQPLYDVTIWAFFFGSFSLLSFQMLGTWRREGTHIYYTLHTHTHTLKKMPVHCDGRWCLIQFIRHFALHFHFNLYSLVSLFTFTCARWNVLVFVLILMKRNSSVKRRKQNEPAQPAHSPLKPLLIFVLALLLPLFFFFWIGLHGMDEWMKSKQWIANYWSRYHAKNESTAILTPRILKMCAPR